jgi:hypothetical protein
VYDSALLRGITSVHPEALSLSLKTGSAGTGFSEIVVSLILSLFPLYFLKNSFVEYGFLG